MPRPQRIKDFATTIRERTGLSGEKIVNVVTEIMDGEVSLTTSQKELLERFAAEDPIKRDQLLLLFLKYNMPSVRERLEAAKFCAEYAHGKPVQQVEHTIDRVRDVQHQLESKLSPDELKQLLLKAGVDLGEG